MKSLAVLALLLASTASAADRLELSVVVDQATVDSYGGTEQTRKVVDRLVQEASAVYRGLSIEIVLKTMKTGGPTVANMNTLQEAMIDYRKKDPELSASDATLLFTKRRITGDQPYEIAGFTMHSSICTDHAAGVIHLYDNGLDYLIVAHEIGHILGAEHDDTPNYLMSLSPANEVLSPLASTAIRDTVARYGSCMRIVEAPTTATPPPVESKGGGGSFDLLGLLGLLAILFIRRKTHG